MAEQSLDSGASMVLKVANHSFSMKRSTLKETMGNKAASSSVPLTKTLRIPLSLSGEKITLKLHRNFISFLKELIQLH